MADLLLGTPNPNESSLDLSKKYALDTGSDLQYDTRGQLIIVTGANKVRQYIGKIFTSFLGSSIIDPTYGTTLESFIGTQLGDDTNFALIKETMIDAVAYAVREYNDSLDPAEQIARIDSFSTMVDQSIDNSRTHLIIKVTLTTVEGENVTVGMVL